MCLLAVFTIGLNWPFCTAILVVGSVPLDWVDGPVARAYHQCTIFGSGTDWLADVLAQVVLMVWLGQLAPGALPWLMIATSVEIAAAIFDFAVTATAMYPKLGSPGGLFILLRWSQANGTYTAWGNFLWLRKQIFWVNLWQRSGEGKKPGVARIDE